MRRTWTKVHMRNFREKPQTQSNDHRTSDVQQKNFDIIIASPNYFKKVFFCFGKKNSYSFFYLFKNCLNWSRYQLKKILGLVSRKWIRPNNTKGWTFWRVEESKPPKSAPGTGVILEIILQQIYTRYQTVIKL